MDAASTELEAQLAGLVALSPGTKKRIQPMGEKSEAFCRQALRVLNENPLFHWWRRKVGRIPRAGDRGNAEVRPRGIRTAKRVRVPPQVRRESALRGLSHRDR